MPELKLYPAKSEKIRWIERRGGIIILNPETGLYYRLNQTASYIWGSLCNGIKNVEEISEAIAGKYGIGQTRASKDIRFIMDYLKNSGAIRLYRNPKKFRAVKTK